TQSNVTSYGRNVYYNNGMWVAVGGASSSTRSNLYYSEDGKTWTQSNLTSKAMRVTYSGGMWFESYTSNAKYYSEDGKTWTKIEGVPDYLSGFIYASGVWVAVSSSNGTGWYSLDGKAWSQATLSPSDGYLGYNLYADEHIVLSGAASSSAGIWYCRL
ncbi:MAG: hypothetical protein IJO47_01330, partial [Clostridia bacterium]|nr:hypothetical protein [Clostridia bacterium]